MSFRRVRVVLCREVMCREPIQVMTRPCRCKVGTDGVNPETAPTGSFFSDRRLLMPVETALFSTFPDRFPGHSAGAGSHRPSRGAVLAFSLIVKPAALWIEG